MSRLPDVGLLEKVYENRIIALMNRGQLLRDHFDIILHERGDRSEDGEPLSYYTELPPAFNEAFLDLPMPFPDWFRTHRLTVYYHGLWNLDVTPADEIADGNGEMQVSLKPI